MSYLGDITALPKQLFEIPPEQLLSVGVFVLVFTILYLSTNNRKQAQQQNATTLAILEQQGKTNAALIEQARDMVTALRDQTTAIAMTAEEGRATIALEATETRNTTLRIGDEIRRDFTNMSVKDDEIKQELRSEMLKMYRGINRLNGLYKELNTNYKKMDDKTDKRLLEMKTTADNTQLVILQAMNEVQRAMKQLQAERTQYEQSTSLTPAMHMRRTDILKALDEQKEPANDKKGDTDES